jgi:hypothetical protein
VKEGLGEEGRVIGGQVKDILDWWHGEGAFYTLIVATKPNETEGFRQNKVYRCYGASEIIGMRSYSCS